MSRLPFDRFFCAIGALVMALASQACHAQQPLQPPSVGGKLDQNGCNVSTGASWCAREKACVQPWALSAQKGFPKEDKAAFDAHCQASAPAEPAPVPMPAVGGQRDAHGCLPAAGYTWCVKENDCVRPWELASQKGFSTGDKAAFDAYCGNAR